MGLEMALATSSDGSPRGSEDELSLPDAPQRTEDLQSEYLTRASPQQSDADSATNHVNIQIDDIFDHEDEKDEFPSSYANILSSPPASSGGLPATVHTEKYSDPQVMLQFYSRLFPFRQLFQWLNHGVKPSSDFANREFALTLSNDAYLRYQSYTTADLLRKDILRLNPSRFEIGPVYSSNPRDRKTLRKSSAFRPLSKEIVFDIDLTDYDDIRTCCGEANICSKCWTFATMATKVIDVALREDFGFKHILWVYSGRRGVHAWISDKEARELDDDRRKAITGYFEVIRGGVQGGKRVNLRRPLHPHISRSLDILKPYFQTSILEDQDPFRSQTGSERLLQLLPDKALNDALRKKWASAPNRPSTRKWADIDALAQAGVSTALDTKQLMEAKQDILLEYTYPRLDVEVGKRRNHLLKSPFVVHPKTGRVCVPISCDANPDRVDEFNPLTVPIVTDLLAEVDAWQESGESDGVMQDGSTVRRLQDFEKTRLKPYVEHFEKYVKALIRDETKLKRERDERDGDDAMEF